MKANNVIEINGRLYNAKTGQPLSSNQPAKTTAAKPRSIDGFRKSPATKPAQPSAPRTSKAIVVQGNSQPKTPSSSAAASKPRTTGTKASMKAKQSLTLHRRAVKKPILESAPASSTPQPFANKQALQRSKRAEEIAQSTAISRFQPTVQQSGIAIQPAADTPKGRTEPVPNQNNVVTSVNDSRSTKERLISHAINQAARTSTQTADHQPAHRKKRSFHVARYVSSAALVLVLASYVAYLNIPSISMKVAAHRAGFAAALPSYKPAGYSLSGPIAAAPGQVTIDFSSNTDSRKFSLKQQPTTWDSTALLENYVTKETPNYLTYQDRGLTIYIYNGSSAAWVNGGKMYHLEGQNSQLDTDQLLKLATSV